MNRMEWRELGLCVVASAALALVPAAAAGQVHVGQEIELSSHGDFPAVAARGSSAAIVWDEGAIRGLLLLPGASGKPLAALGGATAALPRVAMAADGQFTIAWQADDTSGGRQHHRLDQH